jgi:hypothetical protein
VSETVLDAFTRALDDSLAFDPNGVDPPIALLWPDKGRQWEPIVARLQEVRPVVTLGEFALGARQGPAYWLRCVIASTLVLDDARPGTTIVYLPGISRDDLRSLRTMPREVAPLAALQFRCQWFGHPNGKDWTIRALFTNTERGFGLSVAIDDGTTDALASSISELANQPMTRLQSKHIDADFLNGLLNPDPAGSILNWLDNPTGVRSALGENAWNAFVHQCKQGYAIDPGTEGEIAGARLLGEAEGPWAAVWQRFRQSPSDYPGIPDRLRQAQPAEFFPQHRGAWPGLASEDEDILRQTLVDLTSEAPADARGRVLKLELEHKERRGYVWADLGWTPLALALEHLAEVARITESGVSADTVDGIADWYGTTGWRADRAVLAAFAQVDRKLDVQALETTLVAIYRPWAHAAAVALQTAVGSQANTAFYEASTRPTPAVGEAVLFVDGLRLDVAHALAERLIGASLEASVTHVLAALPTVTPTAKPAVALVGPELLGPGSGLEARRLPDGPSVSVQVLRALMKDAGAQVLTAEEVGDPAGIAWAEAGDIDGRGHEFGLQLAGEVDVEIERIARRVRELIDAGWSRVTVVTDHGWLLVPGGMEKTDLPVAVTEVKKGRCARLKPGAVTAVPTVPWHWDKDVRIAVAPGVTCFEANKVYEHGGVSPQECVVPRVSVSAGAVSRTDGAEITRARWHGLTLVVEFENLPDRATIDLRTNAGNADTSVATIARQTGGAGKVFLLVGNEELEGQRAQLVVDAADGSLLYQREMTIGANQ